MKPAKKVKRFRVRHGKRYCSLDKSFHELGVCIPNCGIDQAHVFQTSNAANHAISRTLKAQRDAAESMFPHFAKFKLLDFEGSPQLEEFTIDTPVEPVTA